MSSTTIAHQLRRVGYSAFYSLPAVVRRRLVRAVVAKYILGAVALVHDSDAKAPGSLLLLRQPPGRGWSLPAGLLARGERPVDGCARELAEESGIHLPPDELTPANPSAIVHSRGRWVDVVFRASVPASQVELRPDGVEVWEVAFHRLDNLPRLTPATARLLAHYGIGPHADLPEITA